MGCSTFHLQSTCWSLCQGVDKKKASGDFIKSLFTATKLTLTTEAAGNQEDRPMDSGTSQKTERVLVEKNNANGSTNWVACGQEWRRSISFYGCPLTPCPLLRTSFTGKHYLCLQVVSAALYCIVRRIVLL